MKFKDIPKLTKQGSWQAHMEWKYFINWLNENIEEDGLQLCPDFQRGHVWTEDQQIAYVEFRLKGGSSGEVVYFNHPGWMGNWVGDFVCVDGLQRITAIRRFMNNEIPAFGTYYKDYEDRLPKEAYLLVNVNNLKTRNEVLQWYVEMNEGGTPHTDEEIQRVKGVMN